MPNYLINSKRLPILFILLLLTCLGFSQEPVPPTPIPPPPPPPVEQPQAPEIQTPPPAPVIQTPPPAPVQGPQPEYRSSRSSGGVFDRLRFGIHVDPTVSFLGSRDNKIERTGNRVGISSGLCLELYFLPRLAFISGVDLWFGTGGPLAYKLGGDILHESELSDNKYHDLPAGVEVRYGINYFSIPLGIKLRTEEFGNKRFWAEFPILTHSFRMRAKADIQNTTDRNTTKENVEDDVKLFNLFLGGGAGIEFPLGKETDIVIGVKYHQSLFDVFRDKGTTPLPDPKKYDDKDNLGLLALKVGVIF
ncbi:MAG: porin family protein [Saprospiraceae bacterium]